MPPIDPNSPLAGLEPQIDALREVGSLFWQRGWSVGTSSNYSVVLAREPMDLLVTASGMDKGRLTRADFVRVGRDGQPTVPGQPKSSAETMLHVMLARRADVGAVLHTHSIWGTLLSDLHGPDGGLEISGYEMLKGLEGVRTHEHTEWVPIFENSQDIPTMAEGVQRRIFSPELRTPIHGFLIRRHGLYTWGRTLEDARRHVEIFEFLFECVARTNQA
jgi:methylthioribulose-1-phosphate dehydratase